MPEFAAVAKSGALLAKCKEADEKEARASLHLMLADEEEFTPIFEVWEKNDFKIIQLQEG